MGSSCIYKIQSIVKPEKVYIGSAACYHQRKRCHLHGLRNNKHHSLKLQSHFNKYGESDLVFTIIEPCLPDFLTDREQYYINKMSPWFNVCKKAGSCRGIKRTEEFKQNLRGNKNALGNRGQVPWHKGRKGVYTKAVLQNNADAHKGKIHSKETREKMSKSHMGNKHALGYHPSEATIQKRIIALKITVANRKLNKEALL